MKINKKLICEIAGIVIISGLFGIFYNFFTTKPLPLIYTPPKIEYASDSLITNLIESTSQNETIGQNNTESNLSSSEVSFIQKYFPSQIFRKMDSLASSKKTSIDTTAKQQENQNTVDLSKITTSLTYEQILKILNNPNVLFVDARSYDFYSKGHIGNAVNIYPYHENKDEYMKQITSLPRNKILVIYCDGGNCDASHIVMEDVKSFGYKQVLLFQGGWDEWELKQNLK